MSDKSIFDLGNGLKFSFESDGVVPDTTADAGPDRLELQDKAQKPPTDPGAEYNASEEVDVPEDIEKANESTFFGIILKNRSMEAFAKTKGVFPNAEGFFRSNECKQAIAAAKSWAEKHKMSFAASGDLPEKLKARGFAAKSIAGVTLAYHLAKNKLHVDVLFKNTKGSVTAKGFATVKIGAAKAEKGSESVDQDNFSAIKQFLSTENDPVDNAFTDPPAETPAAPVEAPAVEPAADTTTEEPVEAAPDVTPEEIETEAEGTESYIAAVSHILRSKEEADAAVSEIPDEQINEVVGDEEGDSLDEIPEAPAAPAPEGGETEPTVDDEEKALESWLAAL
jgi:hypothetical protein